MVVVVIHTKNQILSWKANGRYRKPDISTWSDHRNNAVRYVGSTVHAKMSLVFCGDSLHAGQILITASSVRSDSTDVKQIVVRIAVSDIFNL